MTDTQQTNAALVAEAITVKEIAEIIRTHARCYISDYGMSANLEDVEEAATEIHSKVAALEAEAARWREVAGELAGALEATKGTMILRCDCEKCLRVRAASPSIALQWRVGSEQKRS